MREREHTMDEEDTFSDIVIDDKNNAYHHKKITDLISSNDHQALDNYLHHYPDAIFTEFTKVSVVVIRPYQDICDNKKNDFESISLLHYALYKKGSVEVISKIFFHINEMMEASDKKRAELLLYKLNAYNCIRLLPKFLEPMKNKIFQFFTMADPDGRCVFKFISDAIYFSDIKHINNLFSTVKNKKLEINFPVDGRDILLERIIKDYVKSKLRTDMFQRLISTIRSNYPVNPNRTYNQPLLLAITHDLPTDLIKPLVLEGTINGENENHITPLMLAVMKNNPSYVKLFLEYGADKNQEIRFKQKFFSSAGDFAKKIKAEKKIITLLRSNIFARYARYVGKNNTVFLDENPVQRTEGSRIKKRKRRAFDDDMDVLLGFIDDSHQDEDLPGDESHLSTDSLLSFANKKIKEEVVEGEYPSLETVVSVAIDEIRKLMIEKRENNNAANNCAHLVKYIIQALDNKLQGKPIIDEEISVESSINEDENTAFLGYVPIKAEHSQRKKELRTTVVIAHRTATGLNSILPNQESLIFLDKEDGEPRIIPYVDLASESIVKKRVKLSDLEPVLKTQAADKACVLVGHIGLACIGKNPESHVLVFCATSEKVYYIDAQFYNGIEHTGDPILTDLVSNFSFTTQYDPIPRGRVADDCFYLVHHEVPQFVVMRAGQETQAQHKLVEDNSKSTNSTYLFLMHSFEQTEVVNKDSSEDRDNKREEMTHESYQCLFSKKKEQDNQPNQKSDNKLIEL